MAIITEEPDSPKRAPRKPPIRTSSAPPTQAPTTAPKLPTPDASLPRTNPFHFWFYFTIFVSLITFLSVSLSYLSPEDPKTWFLSLPTNLRQHYSRGRTIKVQIAPNQPQVEVFSIQGGPFESDSHVLIVHGFGCSSFGFQSIVKALGLKGAHAVAIDLPGSGFSDKSLVAQEEDGGSGGVLGRVWDVYSEIKEKGIFWGFDQLVEKGYVNYEEKEVPLAMKETVKAIELGPEEVGRILGQVIDSLRLAPVDLVLHDSALSLSANWISENLRLVRSVVLLDSLPREMALPLWVVDMPVVREVALGFEFLFERIISSCCSRSLGNIEAKAHRILLKGRDGRKAVVGMGKKLNYSFDLAEWGNLEALKGFPVQIVWSNNWSKEWNEEGSQVAAALPQAAVVGHSGGRWPQDSNAEEIAQAIYQFVSSLPKLKKETKEEPIPEHIQMMLDEAKSSNHNNHHHHHDHGGHDHHHGHDHGHAHAGYIDAYGLGQGWAV